MAETVYNQLGPEERSLAAEPLTDAENAAKTVNQRYLDSSNAWIWQRARGLYVRMPTHAAIPSTVRQVSSAFRNHYPVLRLLHIRRVMQRLRPRVVYEFGAGISTIMIAEMLREQGGGRVVSFEQTPSYCGALEAELPGHLREFIDLRLAPIRLSRFGAYRGIWYDFEPPDEVDLVYVDGATKPENWTGKFRLNADLVRMVESGTRIGYAFTDHRWGCLPLFKDHLQPQYQVQTSPFWKSVLVEPTNS